MSAATPYLLDNADAIAADRMSTAAHFQALPSGGDAGFLERAV